MPFDITIELYKAVCLVDVYTDFINYPYIAFR